MMNGLQGQWWYHTRGWGHKSAGCEEAGENVVVVEVKNRQMMPGKHRYSKCKQPKMSQIWQTRIPHVGGEGTTTHVPSHRGLYGVQTKTSELWGPQLHWRPLTETEPVAWPPSCEVTARVWTPDIPDVPAVAEEGQQKSYLHHHHGNRRSHIHSGASK